MKDKLFYINKNQNSSLINLIDGLNHVTLRYQKQDSVYMDLMPGKYKSYYDEEKINNSIFFREDEFEIIENILVKVNPHYKNMGHFGITHYDFTMIEEIIRQLKEFLTLYKSNDIYDCLKLMGFYEKLEQEGIEKYFNSEYLSAYLNKERIILMYEDTIIWLNRVLDTFGNMVVCGI